MSSIVAWAAAHPLEMTAIVWPFVLAILTLILKPRTPEQYRAISEREPRWLFARVAELLRLTGALGIDPLKVLQILKRLIDPSRGRSGMPVVVVVGVVAGGAIACSPKALSVIDLLARKTQCAIAHQDLPDEEILRRCAIDAADAKTILDLVGESRQVAAKQAADAAEIARVSAAVRCGAADAGAR